MTVRSTVAWSGREKKSGLHLVKRSHLLLPAKPSLGFGLGNLMSSYTSHSMPVLTQEKKAGVFPFQSHRLQNIHLQRREDYQDSTYRTMEDENRES